MALGAVGPALEYTCQYSSSWPENPEGKARACNEHYKSIVRYIFI